MMLYLSEVELHEWFNYEPETGNIYWKKSPKPSIKPGDLVKAKHGCGYLLASVKGKTFLQHRLAWFLYYGEWPYDQVDHIDGDRKNNKLTNLRLASKKENMWNSKGKPNKTSEYKGVSWDRVRNKWAVYIKYDNKVKNVGRFNNEVEAALTYDKWAREKFGKFALLNFPIHPALCAEAIMV